MASCILCRNWDATSDDGVATADATATNNGTTLTLLFPGAAKFLDTVEKRGHLAWVMQYIAEQSSTVGGPGDDGGADGAARAAVL
jgi:hypothetical protein